jgi:hypothetical protein
MKNGRFSDYGNLKKAEAGVPGSELFWERDMGSASFYR